MHWYEYTTINEGTEMNKTITQQDTYDVRFNTVGDQYALTVTIFNGVSELTSQMIYNVSFYHVYNHKYITYCNVMTIFFPDNN